MENNGGQEDRQDQVREKIATSQQAAGTPHRYANLMLALVFILLLGIVVFLSFVVLKEEPAPDSADPQNNTETAVEQPEQDGTEPVDPSASWVLVDAIDFTVKVPDGWEFTLQDGEVLISDCSEGVCYQLEPGTPATVTEVSGGRDGLRGVLVTLQEPGTTVEDMTAGYEEQEKLDSNFTVYRRVKQDVPSDDLIGEDLPTGTTEFILVRPESDGSISYIYYSVLPAQPDPHKLIGEMAATFVVKGQEGL